MDYLIKLNGDEGYSVSGTIPELANHITNLVKEFPKSYDIKIFEYQKSKIEYNAGEKDVIRISNEFPTGEFNQLNDLLKSNLPAQYSIVSGVHMLKYADFSYMLNL